MEHIPEANIEISSNEAHQKQKTCLQNLASKITKLRKSNTFGP